MATNTYVALKTTTIGTATSSVTLDSIPGGYTDLVLIVNGGLTTNNQSFRFQVGNGTIDTGNNYSYTYIAGNGSSASSGRVSNTSGFNAYHASGQSDSNLKNNVIVHFQNYSNTTTFKAILNRGNSDLETAATGSIWRSTSAIDRILIGTTNGNIQAGTTISLYGVAAEGALAKATGGAIYSDANYWYHAFGASGTFTPTQSLTADILVVAGGGGGGYQGGGGGAGGVLGFSSQSLTATGYTVTVGAGGASSTSGSANGANSQFASLTASVGGGRGGNGAVVTAGANGGSGGGAGLGASASGGTGTSGQGFAGGSNQTPGNYPGGGGGGAGAVGQTPATNTSPAGNGGVGKTYTDYSFIDSMGAATGIGELVSGHYYFGGGGGSGVFYGNDYGVAGYGGGGNGAIQTGTATSAKAHTGGGGGGTGHPTVGFAGNGGSGVVIVRYAK